MVTRIVSTLSVLFCAVPASRSLQLGPLLSTCVDACRRGCREIRRVQESRNDGSDSEFRVEFKDALDPRSALTEADGAAQKAIVGALRAEWGPHLKIVGEEDGDAQLEASIAATHFEPLRRDLFDDDMDSEAVDLDVSTITVFVDPLDGTREFVEERLENCQVLVGIAIDGESVAGSIGIPFPDGSLETEETVIYGLADMGSGVMGSTLKRGPFPLEKHIDGINYPRPHYATGDSPSKVVRECMDGIIDRYGGSNVIYGGAGNKILAASLGEVACSLQHKYGGPWDLCAPEAILKSFGGKMTDLFGNDIEIYRDGAPANCNERGYVVTGPGSDHDALVSAMLEIPAIQEYQRTVMEDVKQAT